MLAHLIPRRENQIDSTVGEGFVETSERAGLRVGQEAGKSARARPERKECVSGEGGTVEVAQAGRSIGGPGAVTS
jgi:hypothetical protein